MKKTDNLEAQLAVCKTSYLELNKTQGSGLGAVKFKPVQASGVADTGCSVICAGEQSRSKLGIPRKFLLRSNITLKTADGKKMTVCGAAPVDVMIPGTNKSSKQLLHFVQELSGLFISKLCLQDLGSISSTFPMPPYSGETAAGVEPLFGEAACGVELAACGCPVRERAPDPPPLPLDPVPENINKLKDFLLDYYGKSTFNLCPHQELPKVEGPPLKFILKENAVPKAVFTPATVPVHWQEAVKAQLDRDVEMGVLEGVPPNEPTEWQHRMVVVRKTNGSPRRTVDMKSLNEASIRQSHP